jgi:hypothetical protein
MKRINIVKIISLITISIFLFSSIVVIGNEIKNQEKNMIITKNTNKISNTTYKGILRIYIAEPISRWNMYDGESYHYGFIDYAYNNEVIIEYQEKFEEKIIWNGDIEENNVIAIASVFNYKNYTGFANPPSNNVFDAHFVDATAGAIPGSIGFNQVNNNFTHTVFIEEGSATWCHNCPDMANKLFEIYKSKEYPLYFVSLISDMNDLSDFRLQNDYNIFGYPAGFFDGGRNVIIGGGVDIDDYISTIKSCGERNVHDLNLSLSVEWIGDGNLEISLSITNNELVYNEPPETPIIEGPNNGKYGENIEYKIRSNDPEGDDLYYLIEWGDNTAKDWFGPFMSGSEVIINHTWNELGNYLIKIKAKDLQNSESDWGTIEIKMPFFYQNSKSSMLFEKIFKENIYLLKHYYLLKLFY